MTRRSGMTLVEVLVAIFVMGIGLIALLTLFPIGMLRIAQAIRDERCAESAHNARAVSIMQTIANDASVLATTAPDGYNTLNAVNNNVFLNPYPKINPITGSPFLPKADLYGESYPILVDPIGFNNSVSIFPAAGQHWVGGVPGYLRRRPVAFATIPLNIYKSFTLWDDINFDGTTTPGTPLLAAGPGTAVLRESRFNWGYVYRRPQTGDPSIVDCSIVVFDKRSLALNANLSLAETVYPNMAYFNTNNNTIIIDYTSNTVIPPSVRPGDWIMDATLINNAKPGNAATIGFAHANFYRVVAAEDLVVGGNKYARYEVQNPIRDFVGARYTQAPYTCVPQPADPTGAAGTAYRGTAIVIEGIAEVFEQGPVRLP
jgi:prepilin-type N-terminal cleavage/methylation domain-containing protein